MAGGGTVAGPSNPVILDIHGTEAPTAKAFKDSGIGMALLHALGDAQARGAAPAQVVIALKSACAMGHTLALPVDAWMT